jgi:PEP-CTERM motif
VYICLGSTGCDPKKLPYKLPVHDGLFLDVTGHWNDFNHGYFDIHDIYYWIDSAGEALWKLQWSAWDHTDGTAATIRLQFYEGDFGHYPTDGELFRLGSLAYYGPPSLAGEALANGTTPEPSNILLFGSGLLGAAAILRRKLNK